MKAMQMMKTVVVASAAMVAGGLFGADAEVSTSEALATAVANAQAGDVITLAKGAYEVPGKALVISNVTLKGATGNPDDVIVTRDTQATKHRIFRLNDAGVLLHSVTVEKGACPGNDYRGAISTSTQTVVRSRTVSFVRATTRAIATTTAAASRCAVRRATSRAASSRTTRAAVRTPTPAARACT